VIAASKGVAAAITGSGTMLAEHSFADCGNQVWCARPVSPLRRDR
jgi:divalent metal cation (Fe/Co/Zn/Cd) transporter